MKYGGGAMQFEHILEIAVHALDMAINGSIYNVRIFQKIVSQRCQKRKSNLTIAEKSWIVEHVDKNKSLSGARQEFDFSAKFGRPIHKTTITRILKQRMKFVKLMQRPNGYLWGLIEGHLLDLIVIPEALCESHY